MNCLEWRLNEKMQGIEKQKVGGEKIMGGRGGHQNANSPLKSKETWENFQIFFLSKYFKVSI